MRGILILVLALGWQLVRAQHLDIVELGNLVGEMEQFESKLSWTNTTNDTLVVSPWTDREALSFETKKLTVNPGDTIQFNFRLDLTSSLGMQQFEARLVSEDEVVIHGWLLRTRIFEAEEDVFKEYRNNYFPFRTKSEVLNMHSTFLGIPMQESFSLFNFGGRALNLENAYTDDPGVTVSFGPEEVAHNAFTRITVSLDTREKELGFTRKKFSVYLADSNLLFTMPLQYTLENLPKDLKVQPLSVPYVLASKLSLSRLSHDFKVMEQGEVEEVIIAVSNSGNGPLQIEKVESNCDCLTYELKERTLEEGQSVNLKVIYNSTGRMGYERKTLALFTNDPKQPTRVLTFKAHVK